MKKNIIKIFETPNNEHFFSGYFNTNVINAFEDKILALRVSFIDRLPGASDFAEIGYFNFGKLKSEFIVLGTTKAFNWQQGAMLQFLGPDYNQKIIYNDYDEKKEKYISVIMDINGSIIKKNPAVYAVSPNGDYALTIDYERHSWFRRGYSYGNKFDESKKTHFSPEDSISMVELETGKLTDIIRLSDVVEIQPIPSMKNAIHYLEHMTISPCGKRFIFFHRWKHVGGIHTRVFVYHIETGKYQLILDSGRASHYCWLDNENILLYGGLPNAANSFRKKGGMAKIVFNAIKPIYKKLVFDGSKISKTLTGDSYLIINTDSGKARRVATLISDQDGHPCWMDQEEMFVTDTYARSKHQMQPALIGYDLNADSILFSEKSDSIDKYDETPLRCDLHPKISKSNTYITIDNMINNRRGLSIYRLTDDN